MIYVFRCLLIFSILNLIILFIFDGGAGMEPVWAFLILGSLLLSFTNLYQFFFSINWIKILFILVGTLFVIVETLIIQSGFKTSMVAQSQYIIILGARVKDETPSLALKYRLDKAYTYLNKSPKTIAILSGGQGPGESITEAEAMRRYLSQKGIAKERLILEAHSTNTYENLRNSFDIINAHQQDAKTIVVTSRFHVLRSKMIANSLGKKVEGIGADTLPYLVPNYYLREFFAVVKEFIL